MFLIFQFKNEKEQLQFLFYTFEAIKIMGGFYIKLEKKQK